MQTSVYTANKRSPKNQIVKKFFGEGGAGEEPFSKERFLPRKKSKTQKSTTGTAASA
jgi:hypothetical protein